MLEDKSHSHIVSWGVTGDTFVVHDQTEFSKSILPQHFKHNNMASFVRQLNKYDFHKIKSNEDDGRPYSDQAWEFQHPKFQLNRKDLLEEIKRKIPTPRNKRQNGTSIRSEDKQPHYFQFQEECIAAATPNDTSTSIIRQQQQPQKSINGNTNDVPMHHSTDHSISRSSSPPSTPSDLQSQVENLTELHANLSGHVSNLSKNCGTILEEITNFKRNLAEQDALFSNLYQILTNQLNNNHNHNNHNDNNNHNSDRTLRPITDNGPGDHSPPNRRYSSISPITTSTTTNGFHDSSESFISQENLMLNSLIRANSSTATTATPTITDNNSDETSSILPLVNGMSGLSHQFTMGTYSNSQQINFNLNPFSTPNPSPPIPNTTNHRMFIRGDRTSMTVPNWSIQPKVLLVDDEASILEGGRQLLQTYGCQSDTASDGLTAVSKMQLQPYDLVFMDVVMPNGLDGLNVAQQIRRFNHTTPIIGMISNDQSISSASNDSDYLNYGMNDLLPKPFTRPGIYAKIDKYCSHLKANNILISPSRNDDGDSIQRSFGSLNGSAEDNTRQQLQQSGVTVTTSVNYLSASPMDLYHHHQFSRGGDIDDLISKENIRKRAKFS
ncbi:10978_t:CDS:2 [Funneliformis geosporum]|uniref:Transcription factor n=1 Tax=Funneliformis geosporum TaxID=1117311 RepID=A0A9W4SLC2_9GLOM|nr:10978_t:CDS:2 [Funneliformis geosporum]CAI2174240.1 18191_t:CDS:2 [Funneliformis geosporum]